MPLSHNSVGCLGYDNHKTTAAHQPWPLMLPQWAKSEMTTNRMNLCMVDNALISSWSLLVCLSFTSVNSACYMTIFVYYVCMLFLKVSSLETANREKDKVMLELTQASEDLQN